MWHSLGGSEGKAFDVGTGTGVLLSCSSFCYESIVGTDIDEDSESVEVNKALNHIEFELEVRFRDGEKYDLLCQIS